jgi:hypothetical protein
VSCRRSNDAYQIDVIPGDKFFPIICDVFDAKLSRDTFGSFTMPARDCNYARALAILESRNLRRPGKAGANNSNTDGFVASHFPLFSSNLVQ